MISNCTNGLPAPSRGLSQALLDLVALLPGQVAVPGDDGWEEQRLGWTRSVDQQPSAVVTVRDADDIVTVVRIAAREEVAVSVQPNGHAATRALDGTILLRTRALDTITIDSEAGTAWVGAGVKWHELLAATSPLGLTALAGSSGDPTVVGFVLGGGLSWFSRAHGLAAHSVIAFMVVDSDGHLRRITEATDPDRFWALRGGGGDFGIVISLELDLFPAPHIFGGRILWPVGMAYPVLSAFRDATATAPDELTLWAQLLQFPPLPGVPEKLRGGSFVAIDVTFLGSAADAEALLAPFRRIPGHWSDTLGTVAVQDLPGICAEPVDPLPTSEASWLLRHLDDADLSALLSLVGAGSGSPLPVVQIRHLGGALTHATAADGPQGAITEPYQLFLLGVPADEEVAADISTLFGKVDVALDNAVSGRTFFNFLADDVDPTRAFSLSALTTLQKIKRDVDPQNALRSNRPVLPANMLDRS